MSLRRIADSKADGRAGAIKERDGIAIVVLRRLACIVIVLSLGLYASPAHTIAPFDSIMTCQQCINKCVIDWDTCYLDCTAALVQPEICEAQCNNAEDLCFSVTCFASCEGFLY